jgi:hypothetical protein
LRLRMSEEHLHSRLLDEMGSQDSRDGISNHDS